MSCSHYKRLQVRRAEKSARHGGPAEAKARMGSRTLYTNQSLLSASQSHTDSPATQLCLKGPFWTHLLLPALRLLRCGSGHGTKVSPAKAFARRQRGPADHMGRRIS